MTMPGGFAALLILFGVPATEVRRVISSRGEWKAPFDEADAVRQAQKVAREEGYLND